MHANHDGSIAVLSNVGYSGVQPVFLVNEHVETFGPLAKYQNMIAGNSPRFQIDAVPVTVGCPFGTI
jgi:hypothetical protein